MAVSTKLFLEAGPHPCGVKPNGNILVDSCKDCRQSSLGSLSVFSDQLLYAIFSECDAISLAKLSMVSRYTYCWSYQDDLWKSLSLSAFPDCFKWYGVKWRQAFAFNYAQAKCCPFPVSVEGVYSDFLFQSWLGVAVDIQSLWLDSDNIERREGLSVHDFRNEYELPGNPVLIVNAVSEWPCIQEQWDMQRIVDQYPDVNFQAEAISTDLKNYALYASQVEEDSPLYLFDKDFCLKCPDLASSYMVPKYFQEDLFGLLETKRPDYRWLIIGPPKSGSTFHKDPNGTSAWNVTILGSKKWIMLPPDIVPPGVFPSYDGSEVTTPASLMEWFIHYYSELRKSRVKFYEFISRPGDLVFVPSGWWHCVINLENSIAITQNYVSLANLPQVLDLLLNRKSHISGVPCEYINDIGREFQTALKLANVQIPKRKRQANELLEPKRKPQQWFQQAKEGIEFKLF